MEYKMMVNRLLKYYEGNMEAHLANVEDLLYNSVGVAEHPNIVESADTLVEQLANAEEKLKTLKQNY